MATTKVYDNFPDQATSGTVNWASDTIKVALVTSSYTPAQGTHDFWDDVSANEASGTGYSAGGATLGSKTHAVTSRLVTYDAADTSWTSSTITARYAVVYKSTGTASTSPLICYVDFGSDQSSSAGTFTIQWGASGIVTATIS